MAGLHAIDTARSEAEDALLGLTSVLQMVVDATTPEPNQSPAWLWVVGREARAVEFTLSRYIEAVHKHARPVLADLERVRLSKA